MNKANVLCLLSTDAILGHPSGGERQRVELKGVAE